MAENYIGGVVLDLGFNIWAQLWQSFSYLYHNGGELVAVLSTFDTAEN